MVFRRFAIDAWEAGVGGVGTARPGSEGMEGAAPMGGLGREGALGAGDDTSVSDECDAAKNGQQFVFVEGNKFH